MKVYIHSKNSLKKIVCKIIAVLIPLYLYGIYKNGILLYSKNLISFFEIFKVLYFIIIGLLSYLIKTILLKRKVKIDLEFLTIFLLPLFVPISTNYLIYFIGLLIGLVIYDISSKYLNYNRIAFIKLLIVILLFTIGTYNYLNAAESLEIYSFNTWDLLWGRNIGGIASTSIVLGFAIMFVLSLSNDYKALISIGALLSYFVLGFILDKSLLLNGSNILAIILIAPDSISSPIGVGPKFIYGLAIGVLGLLLSHFLVPFEGVFISILICSIFYEIICKIYKKVL